MTPNATPAFPAPLPTNPASALSSLLPQCTRYTGESVLLLGVGGLRWGEAIALRVADVDFLRRRIELHRNAVYVDGEFIVGTLKSNKSRTVVVPQFVTDALASTAHGKDREELLWTRAVRRLPASSWAPFLARVRGGPLPGRRPVVPPDHRALLTPYGGLAGHLGGRQP